MDDPSTLRHRLSRVRQENQRHRGLEAAIGVGGAVLDGWFGAGADSWQTRGGYAVVRDLARAEPTLGISPSTLYRFVAIAALCRTMGRTRFDHLGVSHLRQVLPLPEADQLELLSRAEEERWTVRRLAEEAHLRQRRASPARPGFVDAAEHLRKWRRTATRLSGLHLAGTLTAAQLVRLAALVRGCRSELAQLEAAVAAALAERSAGPPEPSGR
ncbi:MAG: hypothetical protein ABMA64_22990 [Myxococcota bacterium]